MDVLDAQIFYMMGEVIRLLESLEVKEHLIFGIKVDYTGVHGFKSLLNCWTWSIACEKKWLWNYLQKYDSTLLHTTLKEKCGKYLDVLMMMGVLLTKKRKKP